MRCGDGPGTNDVRRLDGDVPHHLGNHAERSGRSREGAGPPLPGRRTLWIRMDARPQRQRRPSLLACTSDRKIARVVAINSAAVPQDARRRTMAFLVNGQVKVPGGGHQKSPPLGRDQGLFGFGRPPFARASFMRNDSPSVTTTAAWWSSRSSRLTAVVCSGRKRPQSSNGQCDPMPRDRRS